MNIDLKIFVARVRHADAILGRLSSSENSDMYKSLLKQCGIPEKFHSGLPLYTKEVALAHLLPTLLFLKPKEIEDKEIKRKIVIIRNALAHAGEFIDGEKKCKPNVEFAEDGRIFFRTKNHGGDEVPFKSVEELSSFIGEINKAFSENITV